MSEQNLSYYQRVLCAGLRRMTKDSTLIRSGFLYWHKELAHTDFDIAHIVEQLVAYLGLNGSEKKALMITMHAASNKLHDELPPVPQVLLNMVEQPLDVADSSNELSTESNSEASQPRRSAQWQVTEQFLHYLIIYLGKLDQEGLSEFAQILKEEAVADVSAEVSQSIVTWANNGFSQAKLPDTISEVECAGLAHALYLLLSDVVGPVESDKMVHQAIDACLKLDVSSQFDPRGLL